MKGTRRENAAVLGSDAVRHFMRSLGDPEALRRNPLACMLAFPGDEDAFVAALRGLVRSSLPRRSRLATIVELCDIEGMPHKVVAARLGLSMRQLYRQRVKAREGVRAAIVSRLRVRVDHDPRDMLLDELEGQHVALSDGHAEAVARRVTALLTEGIPADAVALAYALRARALADAGHADAAGALLREAFARATSGLERAEASFSQAYVLYMRGRHADALVEATRAVEVTRATLASPERVRRMQARYLQLLGNIHQECRDPHASVRTLELARALLQSCRTPPHAQLVRVSVDLVFSRLAIPAMVAFAAAEALEIHRTAIWHGIPVAVDWSEMALAFAALAGVSTPPITSLRAEDAFGATMSGHARARVKLASSRLETARCDPAAALVSVREARTHLPAGNYLNAVGDLREAEALNALGRAAAALPLASSAIARLDFGVGSHYSGAAHMAVADALSRLDEPVRAHEHCRAGLAAMRAGALVHDLARALRFTSRITGDAQFAREERRLLAG